MLNIESEKADDEAFYMICSLLGVSEDAHCPGGLSNKTPDVVTLSLCEAEVSGAGVV